jgi:predicted transposase/invertase (TIGR01784 family)
MTIIWLILYFVCYSDYRRYKHKSSAARGTVIIVEGELLFMDIKILPVKSDVIFRLFLADERNQEFLLGFLKAVLLLPEDDYNEIEIADPLLLREFKGDKLGIVDVKLRTKSRKVIHIEIQISITPDLRERIIFYDAKLITEQIKTGDDYDTIKRVISIIITDEKMIPNSEKYHHRFTFYDCEAGVELTDLIEINTLELEKLPKNADDTPLYDWASFIAAESEEELTVLSERNPQIGKAVVKLRELSADERARDLYERREKERRDIASQNKWARQEGRQEGRLEGRLEGMFEVARNLLSVGDSAEKISKVTGLTIDEVKELYV